MSLAILAEALIRIEHKVDQALKRLSFLDSTPYPQVHFIGTPCPVCNQMIDYQIDINSGVAVRRCGCKSGKLPPLIPLFPVPGANHGNPTPAREASDPEPTGGEAGDSRRR